MDGSLKKIDKKYPRLPFENRDGSSSIDLNMHIRYRKRYVQAFNRKEQIPYPSEIKELLKG